MSLEERLLENTLALQSLEKKLSEVLQNLNKEDKKLAESVFTREELGEFKSADVVPFVKKNKAEEPVNCEVDHKNDDPVCEQKDEPASLRALVSDKQVELLSLGHGAALKAILVNKYNVQKLSNMDHSNLKDYLKDLEALEANG